MIRFSLYLPDEVYEALRKESFDSHIPMNKLIVDRLKEIQKKSDRKEVK